MNRCNQSLLKSSNFIPNYAFRIPNSKKSVQQDGLFFIHALSITILIIAMTTATALMGVIFSLNRKRE